MRKSDAYFKVTGMVQGVMFRQTFIRGAQTRGLKAAASNLSDGSVSCFVYGPTDMIDDIIAKLLSGEPINSWGAMVDKVIPVPDPEGIPFEDHQVTSSNVGTFNWSQDVEMYL
ncbi:MAG: acylphosphatase [Gammaproteobacteria bacterium]|nr:acylphosphatase [Gammaproteobacteria bacterium]